MFISWGPHALQHARLPCPSVSPRVCSNSCASSRWCHLTISSFITPFSFCLHSFPASETFPMSQVFTSQVAKVLVLQLQHQAFQWVSGLVSFRIDWVDLAHQRTLKSLLQHHSLKASILWLSAIFMVQLSHPYVTTGKTIAVTVHIFVGKMTSLLFNTLSRFVITFLLRRKRLLISWLQSLSKVILEPKKMKSVTVSTFPLLFAVKW